MKRGPTYLPRTAAIVLLPREYWTALVQEFQSHVYYYIDPSPEWQGASRNRFQLLTNHRHTVLRMTACGKFISLNHVSCSSGRRGQTPPGCGGPRRMEPGGRNTGGVP